MGLCLYGLYSSELNQPTNKNVDFVVFLAMADYTAPRWSYPVLHIYLPLNLSIKKI